jgi:flagellar hook assembly protein FlgD
LVIGKNDPLLVKYVVTEEKSGELNIFSSDGRLMKKYPFEAPKYNYHILQWDGRNENGNLVSSGIYVFILRIANTIDIKKFAVIRN